MKQILELEKQLLEQDFSCLPQAETLEHYKKIAEGYSLVENSIAVLSDLMTNKSYIYNGRFANIIGIGMYGHSVEINSIWEEDIYKLIHPNDITERHLLELQYFQLLKKTPLHDRTNYHTHSIIRMKNRTGNYMAVLHRTFYLCSQENGSLWLALCLYNYAITNEIPQRFNGLIKNTATGESILFNQENSYHILSEREKAVLSLIELGYLSKEIATELTISKNTVDRHRQNIMEKLRVNNSIEAIKVAHSLNLL